MQRGTIQRVFQLCQCINPAHLPHHPFDFGYIIYAVSFLCAVISIGFFVLAVQSINNAISLSTISLSLLGDFSKFLLAGLPALFMIALALFSLFSAKELSNETDRDYVASLFSNVVSFAALIIALVALLREVL